MFGWTGTFDKYLDKATNPANLEPDWATILQIIDVIRQNDVQPKYAINAIKRKLYSQNPHVVLHTIAVLESCVKNCGSAIHNEVSSFSFMEELRDFIKTTPHATVKAKLLELIQAWAHAFRNELKYRNVSDSITLLKLDGFKFPPPQESDLMFTADQAPDWKDGSCCNRCRVAFSTFQRKHHCRNCGEVFCQRCSSKQCPIPKFGIEKDVRVCEACWDTLTKATPLGKAEAEGQSPSAQTEKGTDGAATANRSQALQEEEELQLALALSQSEAEIQEQKRKSSASANPPPPSKTVIPDPAAAGGKEVDPELAYYLNRDYWESRQLQADDSRTSPLPSAPPDAKTLLAESSLVVSGKLQNGVVDHEEASLDEFVANLRATVEIFQNRMKSNSSRGRPIALDTYVQSLFMSLTSQHSQLLQCIHQQDETRAHFESLQDKLAQVRDARAALDALRQDHQERLRQQAEEAERLRQVQMAQKLEIMRKQKQEYLQYQRQLALQKMQEAQYYQAEATQRRFPGYQPYYPPGNYMPVEQRPYGMYIPAENVPGPQGDYPQSPPHPQMMAPPPNMGVPPPNMAPPPAVMPVSANNAMPAVAASMPNAAMLPPPASTATMGGLPPNMPTASTSIPNATMGQMGVASSMVPPAQQHTPPQNMMPPHMMPPASSIPAPPPAVTTSSAAEGCLISFD